MAPLNKILEGPIIKGSHPVNWTADLQNASDAAKQSLADITLLIHQRTDVDWAVLTNASEIGIVTVFQQYVNDDWQPLAFLAGYYSHLTIAHL